MVRAILKNFFQSPAQRLKRPNFRPALLPLEERMVPAVLTVNNSADIGVGSLRVEIALANNGDTIIFDPSLKNQTITLTSGEISITKSLTIDGQTNNISISGNNASRIFDISNPLGGLSDTINNLTFVNGKAPGTVENGWGGAIYAGGTLTLNYDTFNSNTATNSGGAVFDAAVAANDTLTADHCQFRSNTTPGGGGAITALTSVVLSNCGFTLNTSSVQGGAVVADFAPVGAKMQVTNTVFTSNSVTGSGNRTNYYGGAIYTSEQLRVSGGSLFDSNSAINGGGAIAYVPVQNTGSYMTLTNDTFKNNSGESGGAVYSSVNNSQGTVTVSVTGCLFNSNRATGPDNQYVYGGGIFISHTTSGTAGASATITNSTFYQNSSDNHGGAIALQTSQGAGGSGILAATNNALTITSITVWKNLAATDGGGLWIGLSGTAPPPTVDNSIIAGNTINNPPSYGPDVFGQVSNQFGYNLIGETDGSSGWNGSNRTGTSANPLDPGLDPNGPTDNGGPTLTIKLLTTSPGYRQGDPAQVGSMDQRGLVRKVYVSMGAYDPDAS